MPVYDYVCNACGGSFDRFVHSSDAEITCKHCDSPDVARQLSVFQSVVKDSPSDSGGCCNPGGCGCH